MCHHSHIVTFKITSNFKLLVPYETRVVLSSGVEGNQKIRYFLKKKKKKKANTIWVWLFSVLLSFGHQRKVGQHGGSGEPWCT